MSLTLVDRIRILFDLPMEYINEYRTFQNVVFLCWLERRYIFSGYFHHHDNGGIIKQTDAIESPT